MRVLAPGFLIAMPQLNDPNFEKSVVLMLEHASTGSMGLIINREAPLTLVELARNQSLELARSREDQTLFIGGPVEQFRGFVLHDSVHVVDKQEVLPGLFLSVTNDALSELLADSRARLRFCLGYSGWGPGQVEHEITRGSWLFTEASTERVLQEDSRALWDQVIEGMGVKPGWLVTSGGVN